MNKHLGSKFEDFLNDEGIHEDAQLLAVKKIIVQVFTEKMELDHVTRSALAKKMQTSRTLVNRLLDPTDTGFTFTTLSRASRELDLSLLVSLESKHKTRRTRIRSGRKL